VEAHTTKAEWEFLPKSPRMRGATYQRLIDQYDEMQNRWAASVMAQFRAR
jgi:hypothetical protein